MDLTLLRSVALIAAIAGRQLQQEPGAVQEVSLASCNAASTTDQQGLMSSGNADPSCDGEKHIALEP